MFDDLRQVTITGGLTRDPELKFTQSGTAVLKLSVGCSESRKNQSGGYDNKSHYFECNVWGKYGEVLNNKLAKGSKVALSGDLEFQQWEQEGQKRSKIIINSRSLKILDNNNQQNNSANNQYSAPTAQKQGYSSNNNQANFEDSIPF